MSDQKMQVNQMKQKNKFDLSFSHKITSFHAFLLTISYYAFNAMESISQVDVTFW